MSSTTATIHNHHQKLMEALSERSEALARGAGAGARLALVSFLKEDLLDHAQGEERHLYPLIGPLIKGHGTGTETMSVDHEVIRKYVTDIERTVRAAESAGPAELPPLARRIDRLLLQLRAVLECHLEKEERIYLPMIERHVPVDQQKEALERMHDRPRSGGGGTGMTESGPRETEAILDVRDVAPRDRHLKIFNAFDALGRGESFILVNDHDPKPLHYQFDAERGGQFSWRYLERGPEVWRVRIERKAPEEEHGHGGEQQ